MADRDPNIDTSLQQILDLGPEFVINVQRAEGNPKADENRIDAGSLFDRHGEMRHRLRQTEEWFRISKSLLEAHSDFHRKESRIEAHCLISLSDVKYCSDDCRYAAQIKRQGARKKALREAKNEKEAKTE